jgi:hypothetical protein
MTVKHPKKATEMKVIVPYTKITPECDAALTKHAPKAERVYVGGGDREYWRLLLGLWNQQQSFVIVEHDVVLTADTLPSIARCPALWCACPYPYISTISYGLACVKFRKELMVRFPMFIELVGQGNVRKHGQAHWCTLDQIISPVLWALGETRCQAHPLVGHPGHELSSSHGCKL